jgi:type IV pilus assembly protein PilA
MLARIRKSIEEKDEGFTLIELLVVIIIIGILAAIAIPVFLNQRKKATEASMKSDLRTVANEMETYFTDNQVYPGVSQSGQSVTVGTTPVTISKSNTVAQTAVNGTTVKTGTFCLSATSTNTTATWYYDSDGGGINNSGCV